MFCLCGVFGRTGIPGSAMPSNKEKKGFRTIVSIFLYANLSTFYRYIRLMILSDSAKYLQQQIFL